MRAWLILPAVAVVLAGCGDRRSFDERYRDTGQQMAEQANSLDNELASDNLPATSPENAGDTHR